MSVPKADSAVISKIYARTQQGSEILPISWRELITDILNFAKSCNALMTIYGEEGSGKTTFLKILQDTAALEIDTVHISPAHTKFGPGWILGAITPWLSSASDDNKGLPNRITALAESPRPILICIDGGNLSEDDHLLGDIASLLNLADASNIKLSILTCSEPEFGAKLASDKRTLTKLVYRRQIPGFNEDQANEFIQRKMSTSGLNQRQVSNAQINQVIRESEGRPGRIIQRFALALGHQVPVQEKNDASVKPNESVKAINGTKEKQKLNFLDDLLAPPKS